MEAEEEDENSSKEELGGDQFWILAGTSSVLAGSEFSTLSQ